MLSLQHRQPFLTDSNRAKEVTVGTGKVTFRAADMRPNSVEEKTGFMNRLCVFEPRYNISL